MGQATKFSGQPPNFFAFGYDWRKSSAEGAQALADYVGCVQRLHPGRKIDILTHSMGGLLARRYILDGGASNVAHLTTIAAPFLGAIKFPYAVFTGDTGLPDILVSKNTVRDLLQYFPGTHELLPTPAYFDLLTANATLGRKGYWDVDAAGKPYWPLVERGWDLDLDNEISENYDTFDQFKNAVDGMFAGNAHPAGNAAAFHSVPGQDDWRQDTSEVKFGVKYLHEYGVQLRSGTRTTPVQIQAVAQRKCSGNSCSTVNWFNRVKTFGDGTVPALSASRKGASRGLNGFFDTQGGPPIGPDNLNAPGAQFVALFGNDTGYTDNLVEHGGLMTNPDVLNGAINFFRQDLVPVSVDPPGIDTYDIVANGFDSMVVRNAQGNQIADPYMPLAVSTVPGVESEIVGPNTIQLTLPADQTFSFTLRATEATGFLMVNRGAFGAPSLAVRWQDLPLTPGQSLTWMVDATGIKPLLRNGVVVPPTASLSGAPAADVDGPVVAPTYSQRTGFVGLSVSDGGSGLKQTRYAIDGTSFQNYSAPFEICPPPDENSEFQVRALRRQLHFAADDNAANRASGAFGVGCFAPRRSYPTGALDASLPGAAPLAFALPKTIPVTIGNAGNGTLSVQFTRTVGGAVRCTYTGGASTSHPTTSADVAAGTRYVFSACDVPTQTLGAVVLDGSGKRFSASSVAVSIVSGDSLAGPTVARTSLTAANVVVP